ncbi:MAG: ParB/RepB/Spo0J family partition protein [bacterium]|nr:ParB/RepB/Spo0J family partition protein [bacterium]
MAGKRKGLGKGLGAYFGDDLLMQSTEKAEENVSRETMKNAGLNFLISDKGRRGEAQKDSSESGETMLKLNSIQPNVSQPRKHFEEEALNELAESMKQYGVLQPLLVQKKEGYYEIIAGERRWRAAQMAGLQEVPVVIRDYDRQKAMEIALIENVQRADLNPVEEGMAYRQLMEEFHLTQEEIATKVAKSRAAVANMLRLLKLDERVLQMLAAGTLSTGHARTLLALEDGDLQFGLAQKILEEDLSVREVEKLVKKLTKPPKEKKEEKPERDDSFVYRHLEDRMKSIMGTKVSINKKDKNKGRIEIEYYSAEELERIVELIESIQ